MKNSIIEKLRPILARGVASECEVVYVLCESRKLLDAEPGDSDSFTLRLYCHWALHVDLSRVGTTARFLRAVDEFVYRRLYDPDLIGDHRMLRELVFFETFRNELRALFARHDLPTAVCDEDRLWREFLTHYAGVIEDGSLSCDNPPHDLRLVKKVVFSKGDERPDAHVPFDLRWTIPLDDGRIVTLNVAAIDLPNGSPIIGHGFRIEGAQRF